ncbi:YncE family protein [Aliikangiella sp. G2MR2-5]|uniref:YncE family protein n=1 Tax=Aliikangiella sp. G2MR2-5 TaxID=2788943 RepID=UPI0018AA8C57|nr:YncE family protein [Aliikangiella sp. G2MR2-5]
MESFLRILLFLCCSVAWVEVSATDRLNFRENAQKNSVIERAEFDGVFVELALEEIDSKNQESRSTDHDKNFLSEGELAHIRFFVHDSNQAGVSGGYPAAWIHPRLTDDMNDTKSCQNKAQKFIGSSLFSKAELDLNVFYVVTLNDDATLSVVDPLFGFGGSKLLSMVSLPAPGYDWAKNGSQSHLYISVPATNDIVKLNTLDWQLEKLSGNIPTDTEKHSSPVSKVKWQNPKRVALQADDSFLWVAVDEGVAVIDTEPFELVKIIKVGKGVKDIVFSEDGQYAAVLNAELESVSLIDTLTFEIERTIKTNAEPISMDYSSLAQTLYVGHKKSGNILAIDLKSHRSIKTIQTESGLVKIATSPDQRLLFVINIESHRLSIIDTASNRIIQSGIVEAKPFDIHFSKEFAYISHQNSSTLLMVPLADKDVGREGATIPTVDTPGGDASPAVKISAAPRTIVRAPGSNAVLIANYYDQAVYFFKEGMAAPMGQFNNYGRSPRAVKTIDRSLRELHKPGVYETSAKLPSAGIYDVVYFMDSPRIVHCFTLNIEAKKRPSVVAEKIIASVDEQQFLKVGEPAKLFFRYSQVANDEVPHFLSGTVALSSGVWRDQKELTYHYDDVYSFTFTPPINGFYQLMVADANGVKKRFVYQAE